MRVAVANDLVANSIEDQGALAKRFQRLQAFLERGELPFGIGKERGRNDAVGGEHDHEPPLAQPLVSETEAGKV